MTTEALPVIGLVLSERDQPLATQLATRLAGRAKLEAATLPAPVDELGYAAMMEGAVEAALHHITGAPLHGVLLVSTAAEALLGVESVVDLCENLSAAVGAPATGLLALFKAAVGRLRLERPVLLSSYDWPLTLMIRSEFLREGLLIPHMARLVPEEGTAVPDLPAEELASFVTSNLSSQADSVVFVGEDTRCAAVRELLGERLPVPLLTSLDLAADQAGEYAAAAPRRLTRGTRSDPR